MTYPHDDDKCRQDNVDAAIGRAAIRQFARLANALGLRDENTSMDEVVDHLIARNVHYTALLLDHLGPHRIGDLTWPNLTEEQTRG